MCTIKLFNNFTFPVQKFLIGSLFADPSILDDNDVIALRKVGDAVGDEQPCFAGQFAVRTDDLLEDVLANVRVDSGQWVV